MRPGANNPQEAFYDVVNSADPKVRALAEYIGAPLQGPENRANFGEPGNITARDALTGLWGINQRGGFPNSRASVTGVTPSMDSPPLSFPAEGMTDVQILTRLLTDMGHHAVFPRDVEGNVRPNQRLQTPGQN